MNRILVLGASGMLGHKVVERLAPRFDTVGALRRQTPATRVLEEMVGARLLEGLDAADIAGVDRLVAEAAPDVIVNCIGVIKQREAASDVEVSMAINARFPHALAAIGQARGARVIHISTDCVFSGARGHYAENDEPDPVDLYGRSKLLGELWEPGALTLRTSMIGREIAGFHSLVEWFLAQRGRQIRGFRRAIFSGLTTIALADEIARLIEAPIRLTGLYHVAADPITKFDLLRLCQRAFQLECDIEPDEQFVCDRSLIADRYRAATGFQARDWADMIDEMAADSSLYERIAALGAKSGS